MSPKLDSVPPLPALRRRLQASCPNEPAQWAVWRARQQGVMFLAWPPFLVWLVADIRAFALLGAAIAVVSLVFGFIANGKRE